jgi:hypothetical protein
MLYPALEEKLRQAEQLLRRANSETILPLCKEYLGLLAEYRTQLYELQGVSGITRPDGATPEIGDRKVIREAIEQTTNARNRTEKLLLSFTTVSGYEAVALFNRLKYEGHDDWELRASGIKFRVGTNADLMSIQNAVDLAGLLRREEYISQQLQSLDS